MTLTPQFGLVLVLGKGISGKVQFRFSFDPDVVNLAWQTLRSRLLILCSDRLASLDKIADRFVPPPPDYRLVTAFSRRLLANLPHESPLISVHTPSKISCDRKEEEEKLIDSDIISEIELLQALTHEIRTPLTAIIRRALSPLRSLFWSRTGFRTAKVIGCRTTNCAASFS